MAVSPPPQAPPARLLVVEDDDTIRETISEALGIEGFIVDAVSSGNGALERFKGSPEHQPCDLVLLAMGFVHPVHEGLVAELGVDLDPRGEDTSEQFDLFLAWMASQETDE